MDLDNPWIVLDKVWILSLSGQSMGCLLNPRIEHAQSMDCPDILGLSGLSAQDCPHIQGLRVGQSRLPKV